jgi:hypothetical protein
MDGYSGGGYPVNGAAEAYWNFGYWGVFVIFVFFRAALNAVLRWVCRNSGQYFTVIAMLTANFAPDSSRKTVAAPDLRILVALYLLYLFVSRLRSFQ